MRKLIYLAIWSVFALLPAGAGTITQYTDRATFDGVVGATTIEDFGNVARFPITTGVLNLQPIWLLPPALRSPGPD